MAGITLNFNSIEKPDPILACIGHNLMLKTDPMVIFRVEKNDLVHISTLCCCIGSVFSIKL